jgi:hypothetical protein
MSVEKSGRASAVNRLVNNEYYKLEKVTEKDKIMYFYRVQLGLLYQRKFELDQPSNTPLDDRIIKSLLERACLYISDVLDQEIIGTEPLGSSNTSV